MRVLASNNTKSSLLLDFRRGGQLLTVAGLLKQSLTCLVPDAAPFGLLNAACRANALLLGLQPAHAGKRSLRFLKLKTSVPDQDRLSV